MNHYQTVSKAQSKLMMCNESVNSLSPPMDMMSQKYDGTLMINVTIKCT